MTKDERHEKIVKDKKYRTGFEVTDDRCRKIKGIKTRCAGNIPGTYSGDTISIWEIWGTPMKLCVSIRDRWLSACTQMPEKPVPKPKEKKRRRTRAHDPQNR